MPIYPTRKIVRTPGAYTTFLCECVFYKVRKGNTSVESTMAEVDKDAEKRTQYNRI